MHHLRVVSAKVRSTLEEILAQRNYVGVFSTTRATYVRGTDVRLLYHIITAWHNKSGERLVTGEFRASFVYVGRGAWRSRSRAGGRRGGGRALAGAALTGLESPLLELDEARRLEQRVEEAHVGSAGGRAVRARPLSCRDWPRACWRSRGRRPADQWRRCAAVTWPRRPANRGSRSARRGACAIDVSAAGGAAASDRLSTVSRRY